MMRSLRRHGRFLLALALGLGVAFGIRVTDALPLAQNVILAFDLFVLVYLVLSLAHIWGLTPDDLKRHAGTEDEGITLITGLVAGVIGVSLWAIFSLLNDAQSSGLSTALALIAVPLGWAMVQMVAGLHYSNMHYLAGDGAGMSFPGTARPGPWDFLYAAFTIGMTAQVSDVTLGSSRLRRAVLVHAVLSFFYNTVILALAVNASLKLL